MTGSDEQDSRPISVAELLARNGTIGAPPTGHRRRRRRGSAGVTVAELTGEIPVIRPEQPKPAAEPVTEANEVAEAAETDDDRVDEASDERHDEALDDSAEQSEAIEVYDVYEESDPATLFRAATDADLTPEPASAQTVVVYAGEAAGDAPGDATADGEAAAEAATAEAGYTVDAEEDTDEDAEDLAEDLVEEDTDEDAEDTDEDAEDLAEDLAEPADESRAESPPLSGDPLPRRVSGPELSHDPRPKRRLSGAEAMTYDPADQSVDISGLVDAGRVDETKEDAEQLRTYLKSSSGALKSSAGALFSGETVVDDLARRGIHNEEPPAAGPFGVRPPASGGWLAALRNSLVAVGQSALAVIFGAGLFIGFDQLWRWNTIVALVLSVLVILGLVVAVRVVRKTEDIGSTLIAVAVGALVTLGPLALLQSYG